LSPTPWRRKGSRTVLRDRWLHLRAEAWETPAGVTLDPWWMLDWPDWVHVVALTPDDRLVLVRQFRPGAQAVTLELPGGLMEAGESDPVVAARREFTEETGHVAAEFRPLLGLPPEAAHCSNRVHFVLALGCQARQGQALDPGEDIAVETPAVAEVLAGLGQGMVQNAMHVGGLLLGLRAAGRVNW
jgi:8-oxo-dGTP pyrophosphatase MutT (NUDIX family)